MLMTRALAVKKLLSNFLASDAAFGTRIVIATAGRYVRP
jgi:hypothetical protein